MKTNGMEPEQFSHHYVSESHPAARKEQVVNLATQLIEHPKLDLSSLPVNDRHCAEEMIEKGCLIPRGKLKIKNRTWRSNKRRNKEVKELVKSDGVSKEVINEIVEKTALATNSLVDQFSPSLKKHFGYCQEEKCLKFKSMPSLDEATKALKETISLMHGSTLAQSESKWITGNVIDEIRSTYGNKIKMMHIARALGIKSNTLSICLGVYKAFKGTRIHGLSFSHHREVMYCQNVSPALKLNMLITARKYNMSVAELRRLCAYMRSKLELEMTMPDKVLKKDLDAVLAQNMSDHVTCYALINTNTNYSRYLRGKLTNDMIASYNFIMQVKPTITLIKGKIEP